MVQTIDKITAVTVTRLSKIVHNMDRLLSSSGKAQILYLIL